jgi:hypothetical protein
MSSEEQYFKSQLGAVAFLQEHGFKMSKSKFSRDFNAGIIPCTSDKRFSATDLLAYAELEVSAPIPAKEREKIPNGKAERPQEKDTPLEHQVPDMNIPEMDPDKIFFRKQLDAIAFLEANGWKISKSTFNRHCGEGLVPGVLEKHMSAKELLEYARKRLDKKVQESPLIVNTQSESHTEPHTLEGIGLGVIADGIVVQKEAEFLMDWLERHKHLADENFAVLQLYRRVKEMLEDGILDSKERAELLHIIHRLVLPGVTPPTKKIKRPFHTGYRDPYASEAPLELLTPRADIFDVVERVDFNKTFCFTGVFAMGDRNACERMTKAAGGTITQHPRKEDGYLVVGSIASPDWAYGSYGTKIEQALEYKSRGGSILIIPEDTWAKSLIG